MNFDTEFSIFLLEVGQYHQDNTNVHITQTMNKKTFLIN